MYHKENCGTYPEYPLSGRIRLAYEWLPDRPVNLLDGGCAWGYGTRFFAVKARSSFGVDSNENYIDVARNRYPEIDFRTCRLEETPFESEFFDCIVLNDVIEHVPEEKHVLNEIHRILRPGGILIITAPHRGLFSFLDTDNYGFYLRTFLPELYACISGFRKTAFPVKRSASYDRKHRHYAITDLERLLGSSGFADGYEMMNVRRSGLILGALARNIELILTTVIGRERARFLSRPFHTIAAIDFCIPFDVFSYNIAVKILKKERGGT